MADYFVEIETDFEYVAGELNEKAARFLLDFYYLKGDLGNALTNIAKSLEATALDFLELQGISKNSNLGKGIKATVHGSAIELRSTAYHLPAWGKKGHGGKDQARKDRTYTRAGKEYKALALPKHGHNRVYSKINKTENIRQAHEMIMPQGVDFVGATGGHYSLKASPVRDSEGNLTGNVSSHASRYGITRTGTKNVQYYGAHVEFGHRTRDGGGIGFVQARPHLRPALRTVSEASRGYLAGVMSYMLLGTGDKFDSIKVQNRNRYGFVFGGKRLNQRNIRNTIFSSSKEINQQNALKLRKYYSVNPNKYWGKKQAEEIGFGKQINFKRYGYSDTTREYAREQQRGTRAEPKIGVPKGPSMTSVRDSYQAKNHKKYDFTGKYPKNVWANKRGKRRTINRNQNKQNQNDPKKQDFNKMSNKEVEEYRKTQLDTSDLAILSQLRGGR